MVVTRVKTNGKAIFTGPYMHRMVDLYYRDMLPWGDKTLNQVFDLIKNIPYRPDPPHEETLMRPYYTMRLQGSGGDCDDKAIALASYCRLHGIPYRFVAVRAPEKDRLHHVYTEVYIMGRWVPADATYNFNTFGKLRREYAEYVVLPRSNRDARKTRTR